MHYFFFRNTWDFSNFSVSSFFQKIFWLQVAQDNFPSPILWRCLKKNKKKRKKSGKKKKRKNERKIERLNLKNIQNVRKFFLNIFLLGFWPKICLTTMKLIYFLNLVSVKILFKMNAHQKAKQNTYLDVHNKNSFTIIHREWRYELFETKCF